MTAQEAEHSVCDYCGLPLPRGWRRLRPALAHRRGASQLPDAHGTGSEQKEYCCLGCSIAATVTGSEGETGRLRWLLARLGLAIFFTMNVMVFSLVLWSQDVYDLEHAEPLAATVRDLFRYLSLIFALPVLWLLGEPLAASAWQNLRSGRSGTDILLVVGVAAAFVYSAVSVVRDTGHIYFEVGCAVLVVVTLGRLLEANGKLQASRVLESLRDFLPSEVRLLSPGADGRMAEHRVARTEVQAPCHVRVAAGERIPFDGRIARGVAAIDEQLVTGESQPAVKESGDQVFAGTLDVDGDLHLLVESTVCGTLEQMIEAVRRASSQRGRYARLADRVATVFLPIVAMVAIATFAWHWWSSALDTGILTALAVLLVACPCALGIATPLAVWVSLGRAARRGVIFRNPAAIERLAAVRTVAMDKTGTLTTGAATIEKTWFESDDNPGAAFDCRRALGLAYDLAASSSHPLSVAVAEHARRVAPPRRSSEFQEVRTVPGRGLVGLEPDGGSCRRVLLGSTRFMRQEGQQISGAADSFVADAETAGNAIACVAVDGRVVGVFSFSESLREDAQQTVAECHHAGLDIIVLSGDQPARTGALAGRLGVESQAALLPDDKVGAIAALRQKGPVAMVGDGINDAPALAAADVGIAVGSATDISRQSADVFLVGGELRQIAWTLLYARRSVRVMKQNLFWAFAYNVAGVAIAAAGWLNPIWAAVAMFLSSGMVVANSLRLHADADRADPALSTSDSAAEADASAMHEPELALADGSTSDDVFLDAFTGGDCP